MARKRPYQRSKNITVAPGAEWSLSVTYSFVYCHKSNQDEFEIGIDGDAPFSFGEGSKYKLPQEDGEAQQVRIRNIGGTTLIVDMGFGFGDFSTDALQFNGAIDVTTAANGFAVTQPNVGTSAVLILPANANRSEARINAGAVDLCVGPTSAVTTTTGYPVAAWKEFIVKHRGEVWGVRASGPFTAPVIEEML
jgi:hypothetical protein